MAKFPIYASGNRDCLTKRTRMDAGDKVIHFDVAAESLPSGDLCIHSNTVKMMVDKLGWKLVEGDDADLIQDLANQLAEATARLERFEEVGRTLLQAVEA